MKQNCFFSAVMFLFVVTACSSGNSESFINNDAIVDGIRNDVRQYINLTYPNSAKKKQALIEYAKVLQTAYTSVTNESDARNAQIEIIRALNCIRMMGEVPGDDSPTKKVSRMTSNTPERLEQQLRYEKLLDGNIFTVSSPGDTPQSICNFDPDSLPN